MGVEFNKSHPNDEESPSNVKSLKTNEFENFDKNGEVIANLRKEEHRA